jgi:hypothetical protein
MAASVATLLARAKAAGQPIAPRVTVDGRVRRRAWTPALTRQRGIEAWDLARAESERELGERYDVRGQVADEFREARANRSR